MTSVTSLVTVAAVVSRVANDYYPTPHSIIDVLLDQIDWPKGALVWEPCRGDGRVADALVNHGYNVVSGDITDGDDFFDNTDAKFYHMSSFGESKTKAILSDPEQGLKFVNYNTRQISR